MMPSFQVALDKKECFFIPGLTVKELLIQISILK